MVTPTPPVGPPVQAQPILTPLTEAAIFLVLTIADGAEETVRDLLADVAGLEPLGGLSDPRAASSPACAGIGTELWDRMFGTPRPAALHVLPEIAGPRHQTVTTTRRICSSTCAPAAGSVLRARVAS